MLFTQKLIQYSGYVCRNHGLHIMIAFLASVSLHSMMANISTIYVENSVKLVISLSNTYIIIICIISMVGFKKFNYRYIKTALILWSVYIVLWLCAVIFSMTVKGKKYLCAEQRCPESMYLFNNSFHIQQLIIPRVDIDFDYDYQMKPLGSSYTIKTDNKSNIVDDLNILYANAQPVKSVDSNWSFGLITLTVFVVFVVLSILITTWLVLLFYLIEMKKYRDPTCVCVDGKNISKMT